MPAIVGVLGEAPFQDPIKRRRRERLARRNRWWLAFEDRCNQTRLALALECLLACRHLIDDCAKGEDIRACVGLFAFELFGRHVLERAEDRALSGQIRRHRRHSRKVRLKADTTDDLTLVVPVVSGFSRTDDGGRFREAEVEQLRDWRTRTPAATGEKNIAGLEIAMRDSLTVRLIERVGDLNRVLECLIERKCTFLQSRRERLPLQVLHDEVVDAILLADIVECADVWMIQRRDGTSFPLESLAQIRIGRDMRGQNLDRDCAIEARVARFVDFAHPAGPEWRLDFVRAEASTESKCHFFSAAVQFSMTVMA